MIPIQGDEDEDEMSTLYAWNGLKKRYRFRETKMKTRCLLCMRRMILRNDTDTERQRGREGAYFVSVAWFKKMTRIQRDEEDIKMSTLYP